MGFGLHSFSICQGRRIKYQVCPCDANYSDGKEQPIHHLGPLTLPDVTESRNPPALMICAMVVTAPLLCFLSPKTAIWPDAFFVCVCVKGIHIELNMKEFGIPWVANG